ncbi:tRNA(Ile)-lysidine synthase [Loktanella fryxellensis]|uniref:tRNA(Ile)-lysidine synthase n=1 Tax=Loktanella fryxellensis TaxID=245187 RepID=A0A1H8G122_9RHOB|nr:tRNA lysidine(34) synthetase TilS [Loktanella fryxellensis]SEN37589.1 tRNA(Ile)-lysidine synthase [Loktanella fryxellensis]
MHLTASLPQRFADRMGRLIGPDFPTDLGVAVSGGGDSMAMLHLSAGWARVYGVRLWVATVDHGLRPESAAEAALVADEARGLNLSHSTLRWTGWDGTGNLQDAAREARRNLIGRWRGVCDHVLMAHTRDDQAETLLMRLARGSGVDGLAAMADVATVTQDIPLAPVGDAGGPPWLPTLPGDWQIVRPLLDVDRAELRHYVKTLRIPFVDDPSNDDTTYARVRMRRLIGAEGLDTATLTATARRMARARVALGRRAQDVAAMVVRRTSDPLLDGCLAFDRDRFAAVEEETQLRLLAAAIQQVAGATYRPRTTALEDALDRALGGGVTTLHGAVVVPQRDTLFVAREAARAQGPIPVTPGGVTWDGRWRISCNDPKGLHVAALGAAGLAQVGVKPHPRPHPHVLAALPGLWDGNRLVGCRALGFGIAHAVICERSGADDLLRRLAH